jgi:hypothetical protein
MSNRVKNHYVRVKRAKKLLREVEEHVSNRQDRRQAITALGKSYSTEMHGPTTIHDRLQHALLPVSTPIFLGIKQFKRASKDSQFTATYKQNAWDSWFAMQARQKPSKKRDNLKTLLDSKTYD